MKWLSGVRGLSSLQVVLLILGFLVASILIFVFGFALGQEMALRHSLQSDRVVRGTVAPRAANATPSPGVNPNFYKDMQEKAYQRAEQAGAPTVVPANPTNTLAATAAAAFTSTPAPPRPTATAPAPPKPTATRRAPSPTAIRRPTASEEMRQEGVRWSVQVGTTKNAQEAIAMTMELRRLGFQSFTAQSQVGSETWYRVRIGRFASRAEAEAIERRIRSDPRFSGAYVTSQ